MRYGVLSDVHGNLHALRAAVDRLSRAGVDGWLCAGDIVGYGPHPNECVAMLSELNALCVAGNHELLVLGELSLARAGRLARETTDWTRGVLRDDCRAYLAQLPRLVTIENVVMAHGSLNAPDQYIRRDAHADGQLRQLETDHDQARFLILGHTHQPWAYSEVTGTQDTSSRIGTPLELSGRYLLNPGAVGQSRERRALVQFMLLDIERRQARFFAEPYNFRSCLKELSTHGLPVECIHVQPGLLPIARRRSRRLLRALRSQTASTVTDLPRDILPPKA